MVFWFKHHRKVFYAGMLSLLIIAAPATIAGVVTINSAAEIAEGELKNFENEISIYDVNKTNASKTNNDLFNLIYFHKHTLVSDNTIEIPTPPPE